MFVTHLFCAIFTDIINSAVAVIIGDICALFDASSSICTWIVDAWVVKNTCIPAQTKLITPTAAILEIYLYRG